MRHEFYRQFELVELENLTVAVMKDGKFIVLCDDIENAKHSIDRMYRGDRV